MSPAPTKAATDRAIWQMAAAQTIIWAALYYVFPAMLPAWEADFGWSKTTLSLAFSLALVTAAVFAPLVGRMIDRRQGPQVMTAGAVGGAVLLSVLTVADHPLVFIGLWIAIGLCLSACLYEACFGFITRTMRGGAQRAITRVTLIGGFAGTLCFPSAHALMTAVGWRGTLLIFAGAVIVVGAPLMWRAAVTLEQTLAANPDPETAGGDDVGTPWWFLRTPVFWLLALAFGFIAIDHLMIVSHILALLDDRGVTPEHAVIAAACVGPMQVTGRLVMVAVGHRFSPTSAAFGCFVAFILAAAAIYLAPLAGILIVLFIVTQGAAIGVTSIIRPVVAARLLGRRDFGAISGALASFYVGGTAVAPMLAALLWRAGGYDLVIIVAAGLVALGLGFFFAAWRAAPVQ